MEIISVAEEYRYISEWLGCKVYSDLLEGLEKSPNELNLSRYVYSSKFFDCVIHFLERRSEIEVLDVSGMQVPTDQLVRLFAVLRSSSVTRLVLCNVHLDNTSGAALKDLAVACAGLHVVDLSGTGLSSEVEYAIHLQTEINRMQWEVNQTRWRKAVVPETAKIWRWRMESWNEDCFMGACHCSTEVCDASCRDIMNNAATSGAPFTDNSFPPDTALKNSDIKWVRVSSLVEDQRDQNECCVGDKPLVASVINDTSNLRAALSVVQQVSYLLRHLCIWKLPCIGAFAFRFFSGDTPIEVVIDDFIPMIGDRPAGIHHESNSGDYWGCLVEKAFAKLHGGYKNITGVGLGYALSCLTGGICFELQMKNLKKHVSVADIFRFLKDCVRKRRIVAFHANPEIERAFRCLEEIGIIPFTPYLLTAVEAPNADSGYTCVVRFSSLNDKPIEYIGATPHLVKDGIVEFPSNSMHLEHAISYFERIGLLLWPHGDPLYIHRHVIEYPCCCLGGSDTVSTFASNPSFLLSNNSNSEKEVVLVVRASSRDNEMHDEWTQLHIFKYSADGLGGMRRCDVCPRNELLSTKKAKGGEVGLVVLLKGNESLQVTVSSSAPFPCTLGATCLDCFDFVPLSLPELKTIKDWWRKGSELGPSFVIKNKTDITVRNFVVAISQIPNHKRTVGVGLEIRSACFLCPGGDDLLWLTEFRSDILVVFNLDVTMKPQESYRLVPRARCVHEDVQFSLTLFCVVPLEWE